MLSKTAIAIAVAGLLASCAAPRYVSVLGGVGDPLNTGQSDRIEADSKNKPAVSVAYGITSPSWARAEAELAWRWSGLHGYNHGRHNESVTGDAHVVALIGNVWLQPPVEERILPYAGGGLGPGLQIRDGRSSITRTNLDQVSAVLAWQAGAGLRVRITERFSADLGVRYFDAGDVVQRQLLAGFVLALSK